VTAVDPGIDAEAGRQEVRPRRPSRVFALALIAIAAGAFALRAYVILDARESEEMRCAPPAEELIPCGDAWHYYWSGRALASGDGYVDPAYLKGILQPAGHRPSAYHPPAYQTYLGVASYLGAKSLTANRLASALLGAGTVVVIGVLARRLAGDRAGLIAAGLAAVYPNLWANDEMLLSESLYALAIALALLAAYHFRERLGWRTAALLGIACGVASLTRTEALLFFVVLVLPLALGLRRRPRSDRWRLVGVAWLAGALVMGPWIAYNLTRFEEPVLITSGLGSTVLQGNCDATYHGDLLGYHELSCVEGVAREGDESQVESHFMDVGLDYVREHKDRVPAVLLARIGRVWDVYRPIQNANLNVLPEGRSSFEAFVGLWTYWGLLVPAAFGVVALRQRRIPAWPLLSTAVLTTVAAVIAYAITRYRVPSEVALVVLSAVGVDWVVERVRRGDVTRGLRRLAVLDDRAFARGLAAVTAGGLAIRVAFAISRRHQELQGDAYWYYWQARALARGHWFIDPIIWRATGEYQASAFHQPLYPSFLGVVASLRVTSPFGMRLASCVLGAATVAVIGLVARRLAGPRAGLAAAFVAAVAPSLWISDGMLLSESLYGLTIALVLLAAYRLWDQPSARRAAALGGTLGLAALARPEALFLTVLVAGWWLLFARDRPWRERLGRVVIVGAVTALVVAPWVARNVATFDHTVTTSSGPGTVLASANCDTTYYGSFIGLFDIRCISDRLPFSEAEKQEAIDEGSAGLDLLFDRYPGDESAAQAHLQSESLDYIRDHTARVPVVMAARVARAWDVIWPRQQIQFNQFVEGRGLWPSRFALAVHWVVLPLALWGAVVLRRRRVALGPLVSVFVMVTATVALSIGLSRYRLGADVALAVLAGVAIDALVPGGAEREAAGGR
jgi:4-amino-4-deoxy-L-arabinose transferase-like glycosyltransferase